MSGLGKRIEELERRALTRDPAGKTPQAERLESRGYEPWLRTLGPRSFTGSFSFFHHKLWRWYWPVRRKLLNGDRLTPEELAFLSIWFRGGGKSTHVEWCCITEGALAGEGYVGYVSDTEDQALDHVSAIRTHLESSEVAEFYPGLAEPEISKHGFRRGWGQEYLATASGWGIIPIGLKEGIRGGRKDNLRFTMFVFDDIDRDTDSPAAVEKKLSIISRSIIPAGTADTLILFPQNLIHENSVLNQIVTRRSDVLAERQISGPVKAFEELELELDESGEGRRWKIKRAVPTWSDIDMDKARKFLAKSGRKAFLAEYQHDFEAEREGRVLRNYDDLRMVIRKSDFARLFGSREIPSGWNKYVGHDWSRTKSAYHANVVGKVGVSPHSSPLPGRLFLFDLMSFPEQTQSDDVALRILKSISPTVPGGKGTWEELAASSLSRVGLERWVTDATKLIGARRDALARVIPPLAREAVADKNYRLFRGSHDQNNDALRVYRDVYGLPFRGVNPGQTGGLEWLDHYMQVDMTTPHPFFDDERLAGGTYRLGSPSLFLVVEDEKYEYPQSATPDDLHDSDLARYQFNNWRMRAPKLTEAGFMEYGPVKMNDDFGQMLQMLFHDNPFQAVVLSLADRVEEKVAVKPEHIAQAETHEEADRLSQSRDFWIRKGLDDERQKRETQRRGVPSIPKLPRIPRR